MIIKPQSEDRTDRVTLRIPSDVWADVCRYAELLGAATTPQYVCVEAIKAAVHAPEFRRLARQSAPSGTRTDTASQTARPAQRTGPGDSTKAVA